MSYIVVIYLYLSFSLFADLIILFCFLLLLLKKVNKYLLSIKFVKIL